VGLLTRNIVIQGANESNPLIGGHFIVFQTSARQFIQGVEFVNMGQQGNLGRSHTLLALLMYCVCARRKVWRCVDG
jgi:hypothetical protein